MRLHSFHECATQAEQRIRQGAKVWQQFNCAGCGTKQTMEEANVFHKRGRCEECGHITDIEHDGCNYMVMWSR